MITGDVKSKVDRIWDAFWSGGISNPMEVIEQITYLLFIRRLDDVQTEAESNAALFGTEVKNPVFSEAQGHLRWQNFKNLEPVTMFETVANEVFPFMRAHAASFGGADSVHAYHMRDARFTVPSAQLLTKVVDQLSEIPMDNADTNGDLYEYLLSKIASAGVNGQFRTPRHIIELMVQMMDPTGSDVICDPACGTAGFLVASAEYLVKQKPQIFADPVVQAHFNEGMFHGFDFDSTMLRIASMNMLLHGIGRPVIEYRDSLSEGAAGDAEKYSLILANPPFAGSLDYDQTSQELLRTVKTKKTELLFLALFLKLLKPGGRAAVIVPDGVLFGSSKAHKDLRRALVEEQKLDAVVKLPSGVFKPYAGVSTAILFFTKTDSGGTDEVWFYDVQADGFSLDDKRNPVEANDLPDVLGRWAQREGAERERARTEKSFTVPKAEIVEQDYDLSLNRYKEIVFEEEVHRSPKEIIAELEQVQAEIGEHIEQLKKVMGL
ncbi:MAG: class I SAM-dependent DNA methyltransferase [Rothia sp. (in: high G+C Gram-positive bacteria)]|nr:class I SAM-dependent DNA methyltransferase [Rothia sp. (in: high G+C Gram-positive bacteria)]